MEKINITEITKDFQVATVNTDAGYYHIDKVASFAYYIRCGNMMIKGSGLFKDKCSNSLEAEMKAAINAMFLLLNSSVKNIDKIILNTDNIHVKSKKDGNALQSKLYKYVKTIKKLKGTDWSKNPKNKFLEIRHVRAHSGTDTKRQWVNDWCDKECTRQLREWKNQQIVKEIAKDLIKK